MRETFANNISQTHQGLHANRAPRATLQATRHGQPAAGVGLHRPQAQGVPADGGELVEGKRDCQPGSVDWAFFNFALVSGKAYVRTHMKDRRVHCTIFAGTIRKALTLTRYSRREDCVCFVLSSF